MPNKKWHRLWLLPPLLIAVAALIIIPKLKQPPKQQESAEKAVKVRVIKVAKLEVTPKAIGYGTTQPSRTWQAVAEVAGRVSWRSEQLSSGELIKAGDRLLQIDPSSYQLALTQLEAQLKALDVKQQTSRASLKLEQSNQESLQTETERKRKLNKQGVLANSLLEEAERLLLKGESGLQNLRNTLAINDAERKVLEAQIANAKLDLQRTELVAPFAARISEVNIGEAQYANRGQPLFSADSLDAVEIEARFPIGKLRPLIIANGGQNGGAGAVGLNATVRLQTATHQIEWPAKVARLAGSVDALSQSLGVVVVVENPLQQAKPGQRPPLLRNTFVEVELSQPDAQPLPIC